MDNNKFELAYVKLQHLIKTASKVVTTQPQTLDPHAYSFNTPTDCKSSFDCTCAPLCVWPWIEWGDSGSDAEFTPHLPLHSLAMRSKPVHIVPSAKEVWTKKLSPQNIERALYALHYDGLVVLENVVDHVHLDKLNETMVQEADYLSCLGENSPYNYHKGSVLNSLADNREYPTRSSSEQRPLLPRHLSKFPHIMSALTADDMAIQISSAFLGPRPRMTFLSGNTALKSTQSQPVHSDADFDHPQIPFALVINVPLVTMMTPENGSTEIWLGTHLCSGLRVQEGRHGDRASGRVLPDKLEERRKVNPPLQPVVPKGAIIIRDLRLWHCGKPNLEGTTRVMLAMIYFASWYRNPMRYPSKDPLNCC